MADLKEALTNPSISPICSNTGRKKRKLSVWKSADPQIAFANDAVAAMKNLTKEHAMAGVRRDHLS